MCVDGILKDDIFKGIKGTEGYFPVVPFMLSPSWFYLLSLWIKCLSVTIQMKAIEQYFPVVLFIMLYKVVLTFESVNEILSVTIQMKSIDQYFSAVPFIMLYNVVLTFENYFVVAFFVMFSPRRF